MNLEQNQTNNRVQEISVHDLKNIMDSEPHLCLIDVRELHEWQTVHIPSAIHIPKDILAEKITEYVQNKEQAIYLHCQGGVRSLTAANTLASLGYTNLYSIAGGIAEWTMSQYPVKP